MSEQLVAYQSELSGLLGDLDTLAVRMESNGMTKEVSVSWSKTVREAMVYIHQLRGALGYSVPGDIPENNEILNGIADALENQMKNMISFDRYEKKLTQISELKYELSRVSASDSTASHSEAEAE